MISIGEKCCGCTACYAICKKKCINMLPNDEGFLYPVVDVKKCVNCGLCDKVCPIENKIQGVSPIRSVVLRTKVEEDVLNSASGGFSIPLANYVIKNGGVVCGAIINEKHEVQHKLIDNYEDINLIRGSKYVQSYMNNCFQEIKNKIVEGKKVLFFGTPCQVYGLKKYLNYDYDNLITVDLVCKGVASPKLWEKYLNYREEKQQSKVDYINFRKKNRGYHSADLEIKFKNSSIYAKNKTDFFMRSYINSICMRKSCYQCNFKGKDRCSDFTIFDAWNATKYTSLKKDDDKGYTNVLIHTNKGNEILNEISNMYKIYESDISKAIFYDGVMVDNQTEYMKQREKFYELLNQKKIDETVQILLPIKTIDVFMELIKKILYKLGLLNLIKKLKEGLNGKN